MQKLLHLNRENPTIPNVTNLSKRDGRKPRTNVASTDDSSVKVLFAKKRFTLCSRRLNLTKHALPSSLRHGNRVPVGITAVA